MPSQRDDLAHFSLRPPGCPCLAQRLVDCAVSEKSELPDRGFSQVGGSDEMNRRVSMSVLKSCSKRALALLLATSLVLSGTPTSALAQAVDAADASAAKKSASTEGAAETAASSKAAATTSTAVAPAEGSDKDAAESSGGKADADVAKTEAAMAATAPNGSSSDEVGAGRSDAAADAAVTDAPTKPAGEATATAESAASALPRPRPRSPSPCAWSAPMTLGMTRPGRPRA